MAKWCQSEITLCGTSGKNRSQGEVTFYPHSSNELEKLIGAHSLEREELGNTNSASRWSSVDYLVDCCVWEMDGSTQLAGSHDVTTHDNARVVL